MRLRVGRNRSSEGSICDPRIRPWVWHTRLTPRSLGCVSPYQSSADTRRHASPSPTPELQHVSLPDVSFAG
jgi:hypothetical protein